MHCENRSKGNFKVIFYSKNKSHLLIRLTFWEQMLVPVGLEDYFSVTLSSPGCWDVVLQISLTLLYVIFYIL